MTSILNLMGSAGLGGMLTGTALKAFSPGLRELSTADRLAALAKAGLVSGATTAGLVGIGGLTGQTLLGSPSETEAEEGSPWTRRASLGGLVGGGLAGAALGAAYGSGSLGRLLAKVSSESKQKAAAALSDIPTDNIFADYVRRLGAKPGAESAVKGAALGALGIGGVSGYLGADEGMQADIIDDEARQLLKRKMGVA